MSDRPDPVHNADVRMLGDPTCDEIWGVTDRRLSELLKPGEYLVCYDMPRMSGLWGVLIAPSAEAIHATFPELSVAAALPSWMDEDTVIEMRETPLWLDEEPPQGLLGVVVADRYRP